MKKKKVGTITSKKFAELAELPHSMVTTAFANLVYSGLTSSNEVSMTRGRGDNWLDYNASIDIDLRALIGLVSVLKISTFNLNRLVDEWNTVNKGIQITDKKIAGGDEMLRNMFSSSFEFMKAVHAIPQESTPPMERFGCRILIESLQQYILIGTACPPILKMAENAGVQRKEITKILMSVDGAEKLGSRRYNGQCSKTIKIPLDSFLKTLKKDQNTLIFNS